MARYFKEQDIDEFRECFYLFARSGQITSLDELTVVMRSLGMSPTIQELAGYLKGKGGKMSFADFLEVMHIHSRAENLPNEVRSAGDLLAYLTHRWALAIESKGEAVAVSLDISKAFDWVWQEALLSKLPSYGFPEKLCNWVVSFLTDCSIKVVNAFKAGDNDKNGVIPARQLRNLLQNWGEGLSSREVDNIFREANVTNTATVRYEDFVKIACAPVPDYY